MLHCVTLRYDKLMLKEVKGLADIFALALNLSL